MSCFFSLYWSLSSLCRVFDSFSSNISEVLLINPSANVFVFGDFNLHHMDWLTYSGGTDPPGKLCYNFSISDDFIQMVNLLGSQTVTLMVLLFWIYLLLLTLVFVLQWLPLYYEILIMLSHFHWLVIKFTTRCPVSSHSLWQFSCRFGWSSRSFERCSTGGYL